MSRTPRSCRKSCTATLAYPFIRARLSNLTFQAAYDHKRLTDRVNSVSSVTDKGLQVLRFAARGDHIDGLGGGGFTTYGATLSGGDLTFRNDAAAALDAAATGRNTAGGYTKIAYSVARLQSLGDTFSLYLSVLGQFASKNLDSSEKLSLGGPSGVRAYPAGEAAGDEAHQASLEFRANTGRYLETDTQLIAFADGGRAKLNENLLASDNPNHRTISGYGIGIAISKAGLFALRSTLAWRSGPQPRPM